MDYYLWGLVEKDSNIHNTAAALRAIIVDKMIKIPKTHLINACSKFQQHIEAVIAADRGFIECIFPLYMIIFAKL